MTTFDNALLIALYEQQDLAVDKLPYSDQFEKIFRKLIKNHKRLKDDIKSRHIVFLQLMTLRKDGQLGLKKKKKPVPHHVKGFGFSDESSE